MRFQIYIASILIPLLILSACATPVRKGTTPAGAKVYLTPQPIEETEPFKDYMKSNQSNVDKLRYLLKRVLNAQDMTYYRDGEQHTNLEAYRAGMWLLRNRYEPGTPPREYLREHVWRDPQTNRPYVVEFPDGSLHTGYHILLNELELLERKTRQ